MTNTPQIIKLLLIDDDPIFRLGLSTALQVDKFTHFQVVNQVSDVASALETIATHKIDLVVLELNIKLGLQLCQQIHRDYPDLPLFILTANNNPQKLLIAKEQGVKGYCTKGTELEKIVAAWSQVISGATYWQNLSTKAIIKRKKPNIINLRQRQWLSRQSQLGLQEIDSSIAIITNQLKNEQLPLLDWLFWTGRKREVLAARWLINQLLPIPIETKTTPENSTFDNTNEPISLSSKLPLAFSQTQSIPCNDVFEPTLFKIQSGLKNITGIPLEIDCLQETKKQELLYLINQKIINNLEEIKCLKVTLEDLPDRLDLIVRDIWQSATIDFLSKYFQTEDMVNLLLKEGDIINQEILEKIPFKQEIFAYLLFEAPLVIEGVNYPHNSLEAITRAEILLQNLIINVANGVIVLILNNFYTQDNLKENIYNTKINSSREIAKLRNKLTWRYRIDKYWSEPKNIFEDTYILYYFNLTSIKKTIIRGSRLEELDQLQGIPWFITIALEIRDALAPGLRSLIDWLGKSLVYLLTEILGKGIGLSGKGIIQGIGNALEETRYRRKQ